MMPRKGQALVELVVSLTVSGFICDVRRAREAGLLLGVGSLMPNCGGISPPPPRPSPNLASTRHAFGLFDLLSILKTY